MSSDLYGLSDLPLVPIVLLTQDFYIVYSAFMSSIREVFFYCRINSLSGGVFLETSAQASSCFTNVILRAILALYVINYPALVFFLGLVLGFH